MTTIRLKFGPPDVAVVRRADGALLVRSPHALGPYALRVTDWLDHWASVAPERVFLAERAGEAWRKLTYAQARAAARSIAQGLIDRGLDAEHPVAILSGNSIDHALVGLGALLAGVPYAPVSPPYSLIAKDFAKLKAIIALLTPGLVFVNDGAPFAAALEAAVPKSVEVVAGVNPPAGRPSTTLAEILATPGGAAVDAAQAKVGPDTIAKLLFTSGSTGAPKGVINTHRMMTSNQAMLRELNPSYGEQPPTLIDWLPWSHTFGGNNNFNLVLSNGGSFFIDDGRPLPGAIEATVRNLREVSPTVYYNVPKGFEMLLPYVQQDAALRKSLFANLQAFVYAGAALPPHVRDEFERLGRETVGEAAPMLTSLGSTETGPSAISVTAKARQPGVVGIPNPGVELKLVPNEDKLEARLKSPSITPGYWRQPELTTAAFDEEGYYKLGDALRFHNEGDPEEGFVFDGRVAEDFKLATGTWVSVGPLRLKFVAHCAPYVTDVVVAGHDRDDATALIVPNLAACLDLAGGLDATANAATILAHRSVREKFSALLASFNTAAAGSSARFARIILMDDPPSLDSGELTDKGSINQRAALAHCEALVEELYANRRRRGQLFETARRTQPMKLDTLVAIDVHTHAEVSCRQPADAFWQPYEDAANTYFKAGKRPTIAETVAYYRERKIGLVMFTVDSEHQIGNRRIPNEEVAEAAAANSDMMIAFASIDPHKGKMGAREARDLIAAGVIKGFKFHPTVQGFFPNDRMAYALYEVIAEHKLPAIFHSGHSGIGTGMPGGGGMRLKYSNPIHIDDVAVDFPDMTIIIAHPSWPWQDEALSVCLHKPNVYIDLSGWSPKYFPPQLVQYANTQLKTKMLFGSDFPLIPPDRWIKDFREAGFKPEVHDLILKQNAIRALKIAAD